MAVIVQTDAVKCWVFPHNQRKRCPWLMINVTVCIYSTDTLMGICVNENIFHFRKYRLILVLVLIYNSNLWFLLNYILLTCCTDLYCMSNSRSKQLLYLLYNCCQIRPTHSQISNLLGNPSNEIIRTAPINLVWKHMSYNLQSCKKWLILCAIHLVPKNGTYYCSTAVCTGQCVTMMKHIYLLNWC